VNPIYSISVRDLDDTYIVTGYRCYIIRATMAERLLVFAKTDPDAGYRSTTQIHKIMQAEHLRLPQLQWWSE
jgi:alkylation response protein AidB-like acyl-CoA dehydrogenase